jgi:hypothetical protein
MDARRDAGRKKYAKYLTSRIDNLRRKVLVLIPDHLAECVLNGRIVAVDKVAIDKLHRQTRFACAVGQSATSHMLTVDDASCNMHELAALTDSSAANNGHLSLLGSRHIAAAAAGFLRRSCRS